MIGNRTTRRAVWVGLALVVVAAVGGASAAAGSEHGFRLIETTTHRATVDVDRSGSSTPGDEFIFHSTLANGAGTIVGSVDGHCTQLLSATTMCHAVMTLRAGTLSTTFVAAVGSPTLHIAIDGGTGAFDRAHGQITATAVSATAFSEVIDIDD
jgi:hypothetical protein